MIKSFKHKGLKRLYEQGDTSKINPNHLGKVTEILSALDIATEPRDLDMPHFRFHPLKGDLKNFYAVSVSGNWRIIFQFDEEPEKVDLVDYH